MGRFDSFAAPLPLTVGTAGHIDHGKTELVRALTGVDTDRLPEEKTRGITIVLGYAPLRLPSGRVLSLVDVPGHERLIRIMVSGATGIDLFLLVVAADDGVMPQTLEHLRVLEALGIGDGVVAITKTDLADPAPATEQVRQLLPGIEVVPCSARAGTGIDAVAAALDRAAQRVAPRPGGNDGAGGGEPILHVDRSFTIRGAGTVVTGTLWAGAIERGDHLVLLPEGRPVRVRGVQVHDAGVDRALAGQRVALNLAGIERRAVRRGDVVAGKDAPLAVTYRLHAQLLLHEELSDRERIQVHHGTRDAPARAVRLEDGSWQLRLERPVVAADGDRIVVRRISPPDTLGGGVVVSPAPRRGGQTDAQESAAPAAPAEPPAPPQPEPLGEGALALEERLHAAGHRAVNESELEAEGAGDDLRELRAAGRAVRVGRAMYVHPDAVGEVRAVVERIIAAEGAITLARLRDELSTSRKHAQAWLEHLDAARVTRRLPDDRRVLRRSAGNASVSG